jgi:hypothetical protein
MYLSTVGAFPILLYAFELTVFSFESRHAYYGVYTLYLL